MHLAEKCSRPVAAQMCVNEIFLIGGFDWGNLNTVGAPGSQPSSQPSLAFLDTCR